MAQSFTMTKSTIDNVLYNIVSTRETLSNDDVSHIKIVDVESIENAFKTLLFEGLSYLFNNKI